jgi:hypothetical protein
LYLRAWLGALRRRAKKCKAAKEASIEFNDPKYCNQVSSQCRKLCEARRGAALDEAMCQVLNTCHESNENCKTLERSKKETLSKLKACEKKAPRNPASKMTLQDLYKN